ncbi:MAG: alpha/beta fold hydrolase [Desulfitobacteriaceae bacterium]|jgi:pimeloyl-ACP methyl ester carboxylesterase|nr:alpha/beta fold hydrolase [Desulfitobacteriaceae bacterium]
MSSQALAKPEIKPRRKKLKIILVMVLLVLMLATTGIFGVSAYAGWNLTHPVRQALDTTPSAMNLDYKDVTFISRGDELVLNGWLIPSPSSGKTVIFAHGYRKNRLNPEVPILPIAKELVDRGYNVLMFDFRNSGESEGKMTSVGQYEVNDLLGAVDFVRSQPSISEKVVLFGFSLGASTAILAGAREPSVTAVIADSPFADLKPYLEENLSVWSNLPSIPFNQAFFLIVPPLTGLHPETVSPVKEIKKFGRRPVLLIHGQADIDIPIENSEELQRAYPRSQLLKVPGAGHIKNYATGKQQYLSTVSAFLKTI